MEFQSETCINKITVYKLDKMEGQCQPCVSVINVQNSNDNLGTKLLDDYVGVDGPISVSVQESETRQPLCSHGRPHIGLNPPNTGVIKERPGFAVDIRIHFVIGAAKRILQSGWFVFFPFHRTISPLNKVLSGD